ncbi:MAG: hypothetical protein ACI85O_003332 [Saprospiraceae bacterium]|jgi:hypothetical protein
MKKLLIIFALLALNSNFTYAQSCTSYISLTSQEEVDNFLFNYPNSISFNSGLQIYGDDITNLLGLSHVKSIGNCLTISGTSLTNLAGLDSLTFVDSNLRIGGNSQLTDLSALSNLHEVGWSFSIFNNENLTSLYGLHNIANNYVTIAINDCPLLTECHIENICQLFSNYISYYITNNGASCNSREEIVEACNFPDDNNLSTPCFKDGFEEWEQDTLPLNWETDFVPPWTDSINIVKIPALIEGDYAVSLRSNIPYFEGNLDTKIRFELPCNTDLLDITFTYRCLGEGQCKLNLGQIREEMEGINSRDIWNAVAGNDDTQHTVTLQNIKIYPSFDFFSSIELEASPVWTAVGSYGISEFIIDDISVVAKEFVSSVQKSPENNVWIYPNPTSSELFIDTESTFERIIIYDNLGRKVRNFDFEERIDIGQLKNGIYFIVLKNDKNRVWRKVIKE